MKWLKIAGLVALGVVLLAVAAGAYWFTAKPWIPALEIAEPGSGGQRIDRGGVFANFYPTKLPGKQPGILIVGGSEGGISQAVDAMAKAIHAEGYNVLNISMYRAPQQTQQLVEVPLEVFDRALDFLKQQPNVNPQAIGLIGASKGAEAVLLVATRQPEIRLVIAGMPSSVSWAGIDWNRLFTSDKPQSSWSVGGKPLPYLPYGEFDTKKGTFSLYESGLKGLPAQPLAAIAIEQAKAQVLLICGESDSLWPSCEMSRMLQQRAARSNGPNVQLLAYRDAGHAVFGMPVDRRDERDSKLASLGGSFKGNADARDDALPKMKAFLKEGFR